MKSDLQCAVERGSQRRTHYATSAATIMAASLALIVPLQASEPVSERLHHDRDVIRRGKLSNGFRYTILSTRDYGRQIAVRFEVKAGSGAENSDAPEAAHIVEHVVASRPSPEFPARLTLLGQLAGLGIQPGNGFNASTGIGKTSYRVEATDHDGRLLPKLLNVVFGWAGGAPPSDAEVGRETNAVIEEIRRSDEGAARSVRMTISSELFRAHPGVVKSLTMDGIAARMASPDAVRQYYRQNYLPSLQSVSIVGDFDADAIERQVVDTFQILNAGDSGSKQIIQEASLAAIEDFRKLELPGSRECKLSLVSHYDAPPAIATNTFRQRRVLSLASEIIRARVQAAAPRDGSFRSPDLAFANDELVGSVISARFAVDSDLCDIKPAIVMMASLLSNLGGQGATEAEFRTAKEVIDQSLGSKSLTPAGLAEMLLSEGGSSLRLTEGQGLSNIYEGEESETLKEDLDRLFTAWRIAQRRTLYLVGPPEILRAIQSNDLREMYRHGSMSAWGPPAASTGSVLPALSRVRVEGVRTDYGDGLVALTFPRRKLRFLIIPDTGVGNFVEMRALRGGGLVSRSSAERELLSRLPEFVAVVGVGGTDLEQLAASQGLQSSLFIGDDVEGVSLAAPSNKMDELFRLARAYFSTLAPESAAERAWRQRESFRAKLPDSRSVTALFEDFVRARLLGTSLNGQISPQADAGDLATRYNEIFAAPVGFTFALRGPFDARSGIAMVERLVGSLNQPVAVRFRPNHRLQMPVEGSGSPAGDTLFAGKDVGGVTFVATGPFALEAEPALRATAAILRQRLMARLRDVEAGTYAVSVSVAPVARTGRVRFTISFLCDPARRNYLAEAAIEEFQRLAHAGPATDELTSRDGSQPPSSAPDHKARAPLFEILDRFISDASQRRRLVPAVSNKLVTTADVQNIARRYLVGTTLRRFDLAPAQDRSGP